MGKYASETSVSPQKSRMEIESCLQRYGATGFGYAWQEDRAAVYFSIADRQIRISVQLPHPKEKRFWQHSRGCRSAEQAQAAWEQACRQSWRALALLVKAKLEAVDSKISTIEQEFMAHIVMPDGRTVNESISPLIQEAYASGRMPAFSGLLPAPK